MSQNVFKNPFVSSAPALTVGSVGNGTLTVDRLTHFTINQDYSVICTAISPFTVFNVIGSLDGAVGVAVVGSQFVDEDKKIFLTINQGPTLFEVGDTFELTVEQGTDLNQENIDLYDELPQKNFGAGTQGTLAGDDNQRFIAGGVPASLLLQDLLFTAQSSGPDGNNISIEYILGTVLTQASLVLQDITYTAVTPGVAGNNITIEYLEFIAAIPAQITIQDIQWVADNAGAAGNFIEMKYIGGGTAGAELVNVTGTGVFGDPYIIEVTIEDAVSTADEIRLAVGLDGTAGPLVDGFDLGGGANPQDIVVSTALAGGADAIGGAGNEVVSVVSDAITVRLESGVSTADQVRAALLGSPAALGKITPVVSGVGATAQTAPVAATNLTNGADDVGIPGSEVVVVTDQAIQITFVSGASTATQVKAAIDGSVPALALVATTIAGTAGNFQTSPVAQDNLKGGTKTGTFSFNKAELTIPGSFFEGNASLLAACLTLQEDLTVVGESSLNGKVKLDDDILANESGPVIENAQKTINAMIQNSKIFLIVENDEKVEWAKPNLIFTEDILIVMPDDGVINRIEIANSPISILDGEHLYVLLDRSASVAVAPVVASSVPKGEDYLRVTSRVGDNLVWYDNSYQAEGKKIKIGEGGSGGLAYQELLGTGDGATSIFPLTFIPSNETSILVFANNPQFVTTDYVYNDIGNQLEFVGGKEPALGSQVYVFYLTDGDQLLIPTPSGVEVMEYHTITVGEVIAKQFTLPSAPAIPSNAIVDIIEGGPQHFGPDFTISGSTFDWNGLALDGDLAANDIVRIKYFN